MKFKRHFKIYFKNGHPAYLVKQEKRDLKGRFSHFKLEIKKGVNIDYPEIKKAGRTQIHHTDDRATVTSSKII